jgi:hypothetical protein
MKICPLGAELFHADQQTHRQTDQTDMMKLIQVVLVLCNFVLCDSVLTQLENLRFQIYTIIFGSTQFGIDDTWSCLSSVGG